MQTLINLQVATVQGFVFGFASQNKHLENPTASGIEAAKKYFSFEEKVYEIVEKFFNQ